MKEVSIIIVNYKNPQITIDAVNSVIDKTTDINYEIIVVENGSGNDSYEKLRKALPLKVVIINEIVNKGFGAGCNAGIKISQGKFILLLNNDTLLINNAVKVLYDFMVKHPQCGISGGNLYSIQGFPVHSYGKLPSVKSNFLWRTRLLCVGIKNKIWKNANGHNKLSKPREVGYITGADMMIRKEALDKAGIFDENFFLYYEESELTYRIKKLGYKVFNVPTAKIMHFESVTTAVIPYQKYLFIYNSMLKYYQKVYGTKAAIKMAKHTLKELKFRNSIVKKESYLLIIKALIEEYNKFLGRN